MKILIVKLGALGDVLRTTPLVTALLKQYPQARITWLVEDRHRPVLEGIPTINQVLSFSEESLRLLRENHFDLAINLDKEPEALQAISEANAGQKRGFGRNAAGDLCALDRDSDYAVRLGIDDDLKFKRNKKTYQEISFEQVGLRFNGEEYLFAESSDAPAKKKGRLVIGLNTGSGTRFAGKRLPVETFARLAEAFAQRMNAVVHLLGGHDEVTRNETIARLAKCPVVNTGSHPIQKFASLVRECDLIVSGDTTAMHIAIAVKVPVVAYFASTCAAEIELYGRGKKVISPISCAPCYKKICPIDEQCMKDMTVEELYSAAKETLQSAAA
ncbi:MAG: glycosyltransferase family 9 protein [Candidatus Omnitrophica bacterium]|nr:glycosyltransferase family 9 protein [Candidatus Omnitrophota bacterium]